MRKYYLFIKNVSVVFLNNIVALIRGILVSLALPKLLSMEGYADYKLFSLYLSYIGLMHLGLLDGICVRYAGKSMKQIGAKKLCMYTRMLFKICCMGALCVSVIGAFFLSGQNRIIAFYLAIDVILHTMYSYYSSIMQITMEFKSYTRIGCIFNFLQIIAVWMLYILSKKFVVNANLYIILFLGCEAITLAIIIHSYTEITFGKACSVKQEKKEIIEAFRKGIPLLMSGIVATLVLNLDRQYVSVLFSKKDYAIYSFAYSLMNLVMTLITAMSIVLYPTLKNFGIDMLKKYYVKTNLGLGFIIFALFSGLPIINIVISKFLPNYKNSAIILHDILPSLVIISLLQIVVINYFKALERTDTYFTISIIALVFSMFTNTVAYLMFHSMRAIAIATVITCIIWYALSNYYVQKLIGIHEKFIIYFLAIILLYYVVFCGEYNSVISIGKYLIGFSAVTFLAYSRHKRHE